MLSLPVSSPALGAEGHQPCWVQTCSCVAANSRDGERGLCRGTGMQMMAFVSVYWSASCNQIPSPVHSPLPTPLLTTPLDWAPLLKIGWE